MEKLIEPSAIEKALKLAGKTRKKEVAYIAGQPYHRQPWVVKYLPELAALLERCESLRSEWATRSDDGSTAVFDEAFPLMPAPLQDQLEAANEFAKVQSLDGDFRPILKTIQPDKFMASLGLFISNIERELHACDERQRSKPVAITNKRGRTLFIPRVAAAVADACVTNSLPLFLIGPPGTGKTDYAHALARKMGVPIFHQDMTGLVEVAALEAERVLMQENGATVTSFIPSAFLTAIQTAASGQKCMLLLDELPRVADPQLQNPLLQLLENREYHAVTDRQVYVTGNNLSVIATGNIGDGNYSGNNRRGVDEALADRFTFLELPRLTADQMSAVLRERYSDLTDTDRRTLVKLYDSANTDHMNGVFIAKVMTPRMVLRLAEVRLASNLSLYEVASAIIPPANIGNDVGVTAVMGGFEATRS